MAWHFNLRHVVTEANVFNAGVFDGEDTPPLDEALKIQGEAVGRFAAVAGLVIRTVVHGTPSRQKLTAEALIRGYDAPFPVKLIEDDRNDEQKWHRDIQGMCKKDIFTLPSVQQLIARNGYAAKIFGSESLAELADRTMNLYADYEGARDCVVFVQSGQTTKAFQAVARNAPRQDFLNTSVPNGSLAPVTLSDPALRTPIFVPPQYNPLSATFD